MSVLVVGDIILDRFLISGHGYDSYQNHVAQKASESQIRSVCRGGGALLTLDWLRKLNADVAKNNALQIRPEWWGEQNYNNAEGHHRIARQIFDLMPAPVLPGARDKTYRIRRVLSFDYLNAPDNLNFDVQLKSQDQKQVVVVEDFDLGGWTERATTARLARQKANKHVLIKTSRPRGWIEDIAKQQVDSIVVISNINNFFLTSGYARGSWDAVLRDLIKDLNAIKMGPGCTLILLCENEGVVMASAVQGHIQLSVAWDRKAPLGGLAAQDSSWTPGCQNVLTAHLANTLGREKETLSWEWTLNAWERARRAGFMGVVLEGSEALGASAHEACRLINDRVKDYKSLDYKKLPTSTDLPNWSMLNQQVKANWPVSQGTDRVPLCLRYLAYALIERGPDVLTSEWPEDLSLMDDKGNGHARTLAESIPVYVVGQLVSVDEAETSELTRLTELIRDYARRERPSRPLSIAIFGRPGSGKSFAVRQILGHLGIVSETLTFNLSQLRTSDDLGPAMQSVQTAGLQNKLPVIFWDEFDAELGVKNGWLRYFLSPMQDGEFLSNGKMHVLGRAIFVFAGGVCHTSQEFYDPDSDRSNAQKMAAKVPDFASRVKAIYNVPGIELSNVNDANLFSREQTWATVLRRALIIRRSILEHAPRVQKVSIQVLSRLLFGPEYQTARELENTIEAAPLAFVDTFGEALLPPLVWNRGYIRLDEFIPKAIKYIPIVNQRH